MIPLLGIPGDGWVRDQFISAIGGIIAEVQGFVFSIIREVLQLLEALIIRTPVPTNESGQPLIFQTPDSGVFGELYTLFETAQPVAYFLLFLSLILVVGYDTFEKVVPNSLQADRRFDKSDNLKVIVLALFLVTFWWYISMIMLVLANTISSLFMNVNGGTGEGGLVSGFNIVQAFIEDSDVVSGDGEALTKLSVNIPILYLFGSQLTLLLPLIGLWIIRLIAIYLIIPLGPVLVGLWGFRVPGFDTLQDLGQTGIKWFSVLAFISLPGALFVGFSGTILNTILTMLMEDDQLTQGTEFDTDETSSIVINGANEPVNQIQITQGEVLASELAGNGATPQLGENAQFVTGVVIGSLMAAAIPFIAALGPFLLVAIGEMDAGDVAAMAVNPAAAGGMVMSKGLEKNGKTKVGDYAESALNKGSQVATGNDEYINDDGTFNTGTGEFSIEDVDGADSMDDLSRREQIRARREQTGLLGTGSWASNQATDKVKDNYQEAYVQGRAIATNSDYRSGLVEETKSDLVNTASTKVDDAIPEPIETTRRKKEKIARRVNNVQAKHNQLKNEARAKDYKDAASVVDGDLRMSEDEEDLTELLREHGYNPELESENITETEISGMLKNEHSKYKQLRERIKEKKADETDTVSEQELEKMQELRRNVQLLEERDPSNVSPHDDMDSDSRANALLVAEKAREIAEVEENGMINHEKAKNENMLNVQRLAERGELDLEELREIRDDLQQKKADADNTAELSDDSQIGKWKQKRRSKRFERQLDSIESVLSKAERSEDLLDDIEQRNERVEDLEVHQNVREALEQLNENYGDSYQDEITDLSEVNLASNGQKIDPEPLINNEDIQNSQVRELAEALRNLEDQTGENNLSTLDEFEQKEHTLQTEVTDIHEELAVNFDNEEFKSMREDVVGELEDTNEEYREMRETMETNMNELESAIRERKDEDLGSDITVEQHTEILSDDELEKLNEVQELEEETERIEVEHISQDISDERFEQLEDELKDQIKELTTELDVETQLDEEFNALSEQVESAKERYEQQTTPVEEARQSVSADAFEDIGDDLSVDDIDTISESMTEAIQTEFESEMNDETEIEEPELPNARV